MAEINVWHVDEFASVVDHLVQQEGSRLRGAMGVVERVRGKRHAFEQLDASDAVRTNTRFADSPLVNVDHQRRWVSMINVEWGRLIDNFDLVRTLVDPTNPYTLNGSWSIGRELDKLIIESFFATVSTGEDASGSTAFPAANIVAADFDGDSVAEGLTVEKLREGIRLLRTGNVNLERDGPIFMAVKAKQLDNLLATTEVTSADFNNVKALVEGDVTRFMGINFIHTELVAASGSNDQCPLWAANGMALAVGMEPRARIEERADKRFDPYIFYSTTANAVRLQEAKVIQVLCA